jgi:hypothetical protein
MQDKGGLQKLQAMAFNPAPSNPEEYQVAAGRLARSWTTVSARQ